MLTSVGVTPTNKFRQIMTILHFCFSIHKSIARVQPQKAIRIDILSCSMRAFKHALILIQEMRWWDHCQMLSIKLYISKGSCLALYVARILIATTAVLTVGSANGKITMPQLMAVNASSLLMKAWTRFRARNGSSIFLNVKMILVYAIPKRQKQDLSTPCMI